jgi:hypothetical protein
MFSSYSLGVEHVRSREGVRDIPRSHRRRRPLGRQQPGQLLDERLSNNEYPERSWNVRSSDSLGGILVVSLHVRLEDRYDRWYACCDHPLPHQTIWRLLG